MRNETGTQADARRLSVLLRRDGVVLVPPRLAPWVRGLLLADLSRKRREADLAFDVLELLDALSSAPNDVAVPGNDVRAVSKIEVGDAPGDQIIGPASTRETAAELGISERTVRWMLMRGRLVGWKSGHAWLVSRSSISEYMHGKAA